MNKGSLLTPKLFAEKYGKELGNHGGQLHEKTAYKWFTQMPFAFQVGGRWYAWENDILEKWRGDSDK